MIPPKICHCIRPFFRRFAPVSTPSSYCIRYSVIKDTVTSYCTKYILCSVVGLHCHTDSGLQCHTLVGVQAGTNRGNPAPCVRVVASPGSRKATKFFLVGKSQQTFFLNLNRKLLIQNVLIKCTQIKGRGRKKGIYF